MIIEVLQRAQPLQLSSNSVLRFNLRTVFLKAASDLADLPDVDSLPHNLGPK